MSMEHISDIIKRLSVDIEKDFFDKDLDLDDTMSTLKVLHHLKKDLPELTNTLNLVEKLIKDKYHNKLHEEGIKRACKNTKIGELLKLYDIE